MFFGATKLEDTKPLVTEFQLRDEILELAIFGLSDCQYSNARKGIVNVFIEIFLNVKSF